jgi:hypothetical protein
MEKRTIVKKINYDNGSIEINMKNYQSVGKLKKKLRRKFCLGMDTFIADQEGRMIVVNLLMQKYNGEFRLFLDNFGELTEMKLIRANYVI